MQELTTRQKQVLEIINDYIEKVGCPPTQREIAERLGVNGTLGIMKHLKALEKKGFLSRREGSSRGIVLSMPAAQAVSLPIVGMVRAGEPQPAVEDTHVGVDETSSKRGHNYVSLFVDLKEAQILFATEGKDASTVKRFQQDLAAHKGDPDSISEFCSDMSPAFIKGVTDCFPKAHLTFDKFHIMKIINEAVDEVRRQEQKERPELAKTRYIWLKNKNNLKKAQIETLEKLQVKKLNLKTSRAYHIRMNFQDFFAQPIETAESFLNKWYFWATHSRLQPIKEAAYTIKRHWNGVLRWFHSRINNGMLEGFNSLVQSAKARARGYRTNRNLIAMIYLIGGKLNFGLPT